MEAYFYSLEVLCLNALVIKGRVPSTRGAFDIPIAVIKHAGALLSAVANEENQ